jgi:uncharacterized protein (UPF0261 family)
VRAALQVIAHSAELTVEAGWACSADSWQYMLQQYVVQAQGIEHDAEMMGAGKSALRAAVHTAAVRAVQVRADTAEMVGAGTAGLQYMLLTCMLGGHVAEWIHE